MTVAAGFETGTGVHSGSGHAVLQGNGPGKFQGAGGPGWAGSPQVNSSPGTAGNRESFLSNWQTHLALIEAGLDGIQVEPKNTVRLKSAAEPPLEETSGTTARSPFAVRTGLAIPLRADMQQMSSPGVRPGEVPVTDRITNTALRSDVRPTRQSADRGMLTGAASVKTSQSPPSARARTAGTSEHGKSSDGATQSQQIPDPMMMLAGPTVIPLASISVQPRAFTKAEPSLTRTESGLPASDVPGGLSNTPLLRSATVQKTDGVAGARIAVREITPSDEAGLERSHAPAASSTTAPLTDSTEGLPLGGFSGGAASSGSGRAVAKVEGISERLVAGVEKTQRQEVDVALPIAPEMPAASAAQIGEGKVKETGVPSRVNIQSPQAGPGIPNAPATTSAPMIAIENMRPVRSPLDTTPSSPVSPATGASVAKAARKDAIGIPDKANPQSPQFGPSISFAPAMSSTSKISIEQIGPGRTPQDTNPSETASFEPRDFAVNAGITSRAEIPAGSLAASPQFDPEHATASSATPSSKIGIGSVRPESSQPDLSPSSDAAPASDPSHPKTVTAAPAVIAEPERERPGARSPLVTDGPETDGASVHPLENQANTQPLLIAEARTVAPTAIAGEGLLTAKIARPAMQSREFSSVRGPDLASLRDGTITETRSGLIPASLPASLVQSEGTVSPRASVGISSPIGIDLPPATAEKPASSIAAGNHAADASAVNMEMPTDAQAGLGGGPIRAAIPRGVQPLAQGDSTASRNLQPPIASPEDAGLMAARPAPAQTSRTARGPGTDLRRGLSVQPQTGGALVDPYALARNPAEVPAAGNSERGPVQASAGFSSREAFAALDGEAVPGKPQWTHATPRQAEAGFEDPALGWVGVRADLNGGGVHASLMPGSVQAAQDLGKHMDGLNAFLAEQHTPVESLVMTTPLGRASHATAGEDTRHESQSGMDQGANQGANQDANPGANQGSGHQAQQQAYVEPGPAESVRMTSTDPLDSLDRLDRLDRSIGLDGLDKAGRLQASFAPDRNNGSVEGRGGTHISVVA